MYNEYVFVAVIALFCSEIVFVSHEIDWNVVFDTNFTHGIAMDLGGTGVPCPSHGGKIWSNGEKKQKFGLKFEP